MFSFCSHLKWDSFHTRVQKWVFRHFRTSAVTNIYRWLFYWWKRDTVLKKYDWAVFVTTHRSCLRMYRPGLYNLCLCVYQPDSLPTEQKRGVTEGLPSRWQTVWSSKICRFFSLTGCQSASLFFFLHLSTLSPSLPPSLYLSFSASLLNVMRRDGLLSEWATVALLSAWAVYRCSVSGRTPPVGLSPWCGDEMWKLRRICRGGNKAWHPTDLTPLSSWYQSPHT